MEKDGNKWKWMEIRSAISLIWLTVYNLIRTNGHQANRNFVPVGDGSTFQDQQTLWSFRRLIRHCRQNLLIHSKFTEPQRANGCGRCLALWKPTALTAVPKLTLCFWSLWQVQASWEQIFTRLLSRWFIFQVPNPWNVDEMWGENEVQFATESKLRSQNPASLRVWISLIVLANIMAIIQHGGSVHRKSWFGQTSFQGIRSPTFFFQPKPISDIPLSLDMHFKRKKHVPRTHSGQTLWPPKMPF